MAKAVISTIGSDRPGLVTDLSSLAEFHHLNIEDSRMTVLGGEFAVLMAIEGSDADLDAFEKALAIMAGDELAHLFRRTSSQPESTPSRPYRATISALDHPGIVATIARFFSERNINIRDLHTETSPAPHTGTPIFSIKLVADIPAALKIHELRDAFEAFCADADLDGELEAER